MFVYEASDETIQDPKQSFKINFYFAILDTTLNSIKERFTLLKQHSEELKVVREIGVLKDWRDEDLMKHCKDLHLKLCDHQNKDSHDIDGVALFEELKALQCFVRKESAPLDVLNYIYENNLTDVFPNTVIAIRIYLTLPISVASGERSFSKLKLIKNYLRSTMSQDRLIDLSIISIENNIMNSIDITNDFVSIKSIGE